MAKEYFDKEFKKMWMETCIESWNDQFLGIYYTKPFEEIIYLHNNIEELERYISAYEKKYDTKLTYRLDNGCSYISQLK